MALFVRGPPAAAATAAAAARPPLPQILVLAIFFQQAPVDAGLQVMGLVLAIFGLMAFLEGLRVVIMVGTSLPSIVPPPAAASLLPQGPLSRRGAGC